MTSIPRIGVISRTVMKALSIDVSGNGDMRWRRATLLMSTALWPVRRAHKHVVIVVRRIASTISTKHHNASTFCTLIQVCYCKGGILMRHTQTVALNLLALRMFSLLPHRDWTCRERNTYAVFGHCLMQIYLRNNCNTSSSQDILPSQS